MKERLEKWASELTPEQSKKLIVAMVEDAVLCENVRFWDDSLAPYWEATGDPLVDGQDCFPDDED